VDGTWHWSTVGALSCLSPDFFGGLGENILITVVNTMHVIFFLLREIPASTPPIIYGGLEYQKYQGTTGTLVHWYTGTLVHWYTGTSSLDVDLVVKYTGSY
jgi:hypothetical protein